MRDGQSASKGGELGRRDILKTIGVAALGTGFASTGAAAASQTSEETLLDQDFEDISVGGYPSGWKKNGSNDQKAVDSHAASGDKSLQLSGSSGGCWEALTNAPVSLSDKGTVTITGSVRPTTDGSIGCHEYRTTIGVTTDASSWSSGSGDRWYTFKPDGDVHVLGESNSASYEVNQWQDFKIVYTRDPDADSEVTIASYLNGEHLTTVERAAHNWEDNIEWLQLKSGEFTMQYDDLKAVSGPVDGDGQSSGASLPFEATFEDSDVGQAPSALSVEDSHGEYETFEVQEGGANGSSQAVRMVSDPYSRGGTENRYGAVASTQDLAGGPTVFEWDWKKTHDHDPDNYSDLSAYGPSVRIEDADGKALVSMQYGERDGYTSGEEYPNGLNVHGNLVHDVAQSGEFAHFKVVLNTDEETFDVIVDGETIDTYDLRQGGTPARLAFKTGGWGVTGDSKVDNIKISKGEADSATTVSVTSVDGDVVQTVHNTRVYDDNGNKLQDLANPPLIAGQNTTVLPVIDVDSSSVTELPSDAKVDVTFNADTFESQTLTLSKSALESLADGTDPEELEDTNPVFELPSGTTEIEITVESAEFTTGSGDTYVVEESSTTISGLTTKEVNESLTLGLVELRAPEGEEDRLYGHPDTGLSTGEGTHADRVSNFKSGLRKYLTTYFPGVDTVEFVEIGQKVVGSGWSPDDHGALPKKLDQFVAYDRFQDKVDTQVDEVLALAPGVSPDTDDQVGYLTHHNKPASVGNHLDGDQYSQPQAASLVLLKESTNMSIGSAAHELIHHLLPMDTYPDDIAMEKPNGGIDNRHLEPNENRSTGEIKTQLFDLSDGYSYMGERFPLMSHGGSYALIGQSSNDEGKTDMQIFEAPIRETATSLLETDYEPQPQVKNSEASKKVLSIAAEIRNGAVDVIRTFPHIGLPSAPSPIAPVTARTRDQDGNEVESIKTPTVSLINSGSTSVEEGDVIGVTVPYSDEITTVDIEAEDSTTSVNPHSETLRTVVENIPDTVFKKNADSLRASLMDKVSAIEEQTDKGKYHPASKKLENDVIDKLQKWLNDEQTDANQYSRSDAVQACNEVLTRFQTLSEKGNGKKGKGDGKDKGKGKGKGR